MMRRSLSAFFALLVTTPLLAAPAGQQTLFNFVRPADVVRVATVDASLPQYNAEQTAEGEVLRRVTFNPATAPSVRLTPQTGVWDWSQSGMMTLRIQNAMSWALTLDVTVQSSNGHTLTSRIDLPAGPAQTVLLPLQANSPRSQGMRAGPPMPMTVDGQRILLASSEGQLDRSQVVSVTLSIPQPKAAQSILLERFGVQDGDDVIKTVYSSIVDGYGQSNRAKWPERVANDEQLKAAAAKEQQQLKGWLAARTGLDSYGGLLKGPAFEATGFFRTEKRNGRWNLVTPEGHPFYSLGLNAVTANDSQTYVAGREWMFADLPKDGTPLAAFYGASNHRINNGSSQGRAFNGGRWYNFYTANVQRINAQPCVDGKTEIGADPVTGCGPQVFDAKRWETHALDRLQAWGFNTVGNWSDPQLGLNDRVPYTLPLSIVGDYNSISTGSDWWGGMPDPFDPRFAMAAERAVAIAARDHRDDPWLIGYFADNELAWAGAGDESKARYALALGTLRMTTDAPAKRAFLKQLRDKYRNQQGLSNAWGVDIPAWELMEDPGFDGPLPNAEHPEIEADYKYFQKVFADTYFKTLSDSLKWHAPNHLLLGGRFAVSTPEAVAACAQYCDVLSFNFYTLQPQDGYDFATLRELDKPVMITEFNFGSRDRGPFWGGVTEVANEEARGPAYAKFVKQALAEPSIVGVHWFQYLDQPVTGRLLDGENGHFGMIGITDLPFTGFVESVRKTNVQALEQLSQEASKAQVDADEALKAPRQTPQDGNDGGSASGHAGGHSGKGH